MDKAKKLPVLRKAAWELLHWMHNSYEYLLYLLGFSLVIYLGNFLDTRADQSPVRWLLPGITFAALLAWIIIQKKGRPFKSETDLHFIDIKIKTETAFFYRQLVYVLLVLFSLVLVYVYFPAQVTYFDYTFYQAFLAGSFFLLARERKVILTHNEPLSAGLTAVLPAYAFFLLSWGTIASVFTFALQFVHIAYIFIKEFLLSVITWDNRIPREWSILALCGTAGLIISLKAELKKYRETAWKKLLGVLPLVFLALFLGSGIFLFIRKQVLGGNTLPELFLEKYSNGPFTDHGRPVNLEQALIGNFPGISLKTSQETQPVLRSSLPADFDNTLVRASSTYVSGANVVYSADRILDNNTGTCWIAERAASEPELELILKQPVNMNGFIIKNGNQAGRELFSKHNRPGHFILTGYAEGKTVFVHSYYLKADSTDELFMFKQGCFVDRLQLRVVSQHEGSNRGYCAISDFLITGFFGKKAAPVIRKQGDSQ